MMNWENIQKIRKCINCLILFLIVSSLGFKENNDIFVRTWTQIPGTQAQKIFQDLRNRQQFWVLTSNALYLAQMDKPAKIIINKTPRSLFQNPSEPNNIYVVTDDGISILDQDLRMRSLLIERECQSVISLEDRVFVGTKHGLMIRDKEDARWRKAQGKLSSEPIHLLASYGEIVYVVTPTALYRYDAASDDYKIIFSTGVSHETEGITETTEDSIDSQMAEIFDIDVQSSWDVYVASLSGIYFSSDQGGHWDRISLKGLAYRSVTSLAIDPQNKQLWVGTKDGVFKLNTNRWSKIYRGLPTNQITDILINDQGDVYTATNRGFFILTSRKTLAAMNRSEYIFDHYRDAEDYFTNEPTVRQVQAMAVDYADVHPDKIKRWHRQSRLKALVPSLSTGIDRSATDLMHWDTGPNPDVLSKGNDFIDWDVSLSWDLGEMVWSSDQTSIDSSSKLMVELREEVLDQVTRIYFERRRVQLSLLSDDEYTNVMEEEMRLSELTAILDGYTGGRFSQTVNERI